MVVFDYIYAGLTYLQTFMFWAGSPVGLLAVYVYCWIFERGVEIKKEWGE